MSDAWLTSIDLGAAAAVLSGSVSPAFDTFRGGKRIVAYGSARLTDSSLDVDFRGLTLPVGWSASPSGSGIVSSLFTGLHLSTGPQASSVASVADSTSRDSFEAEVTARVLGPPRAVGSSVTCLAFRYEIDASNYVEVRVRKDPLFGEDVTIVDSLVETSAEGLQQFGALVVDGPRTRLRILRHSRWVFAYADDILIGQFPRFSTSTSGTMSLRAENNSESSKVSTLVTTLTLRSQVLIKERPLEDKIDVGEHRLEGAVPAATLADVGLHPIILFGPWGSVNASEGFEYTLPTGRTVGVDLISALSSYTDPTVRDE